MKITTKHSDSKPKPNAKVAAMGDLHTKHEDNEYLASLVKKAADAADVLLLAGDLTDSGTAKEAKNLRDILSPIRIPIFAVLGNHDYDSGQQDEVREIIATASVGMLEGDSECIDIDGAKVGFAGTKGFWGGFYPFEIVDFGEPEQKRLVSESVRQASLLRRSFEKLETDVKVVLLHYAPISQTLRGEPEVLFPFLGCSRLWGPIEDHKPKVVFHGHSHLGAPFFMTEAGIPVYNVAMPVVHGSFVVVNVNE